MFDKLVYHIINFAVVTYSRIFGFDKFTEKMMADFAKKDWRRGYCSDDVYFVYILPEMTDYFLSSSYEDPRHLYWRIHYTLKFYDEVYCEMRDFTKRVIVYNDITRLQGRTDFM